MGSHKAGESLQQSDTDHGTWVAKKLLTCTNTELQFFSMAALNPMLWLHWVSQDCLVLAPIPAKQRNSVWEATLAFQSLPSMQLCLGKSGQKTLACHMWNIHHLCTWSSLGQCLATLLCLSALALSWPLPLSWLQAWLWHVMLLSAWM